MTWTAWVWVWLFDVALALLIARVLGFGRMDDES